MKPTRELRRSKRENDAGRLELERIERLGPAERGRIREEWWRERRYLVVTPGDELIRAALAPFPAEVRERGARARFRRYDDRGGGGFWPDTNDIWLAAGVETYESLAQVVMSARHELFHFVNWNHQAYREDLDRGYPGLRAALAEARAGRASHAGPGSHERYWSWIAHSFVPQGDHANPVELWADIPTNFPDPAELPASIALYFAPLLVEGAVRPALPARRAVDDGLPAGRAVDDGLPAFHTLIAPGTPTRTP